MPLSAATKRLAVTYGSFTLDNTNGIALQAKDRRYILRETHQEGFFSCDFVLRLTSETGTEATDDASMVTLERAVWTNLHKRRLKLTVSLNGTTINGNGSGWDPATNVKTAFLLESEIEKIGSPHDNARHITFRFTVRCQFPAESANNYVRDSATQTITGVNGRRICIARATFTGYASTTSQASYTANGDTHFNAQLPTNVSNGEWVVFSEDPTFDYEDSTLTVTRVYWEVVNGLREYQADITTLPNGARQIVVSGFYMTTSGASAESNYTTNVGTLVGGILSAEGGSSLYEATSVPKVRRYDTTGKLYRFVHTYNEICYQQSTSTNDANVSSYTLQVKQLSGFDRQSISSINAVTRLKRAQAFYTAVIDKTSSGGTDPYAIWTSKLRAYVVNAVATKLGSLSVIVEEEEVGPGLDTNTLTATLTLLVRGGSLLSLTMQEQITRTPSFDLTPQGDGQAHSYYPDRIPCTKVLDRIVLAEYASGGDKPKFWQPGESASGYSFVDTGKSMEQALDAMEQGTLPGTPCWFPRGALVERHIPGSRGEDDSLQTILYFRQESWTYVAKFPPDAVNA